MIKVILTTVLALLFFMIILIILNVLYRRTFHFYNQFCFEKEFFSISDYKEIDFAATGTSNARNAFATLQNSGNLLCLARGRQGLKLDYYLLNNEINKIPKGSKIFITLSPCVLLFNESLENDIDYHAWKYNKDQITISVKRRIELVFPIVIHPTRIKNIFVDSKKKTSIYDNKINSHPQCVNNMNTLAKSWMELFNIKSFSKESLKEENYANIQKNKAILEKMIDRCFEANCIPYLVVTPFSNLLNSYFDKSFLDETINKVIAYLQESKKIISFNFMFDNDFKETLFEDGGFLLNETGSKLFLQKLMSFCNNEKM